MMIRYCDIIMMLIFRLRDLSNQEKLENQRLVKDLDKQVSTLASMKELKERLEEELKVLVLLKTYLGLIFCVSLCRKQIHLLMN